MIGNAVKFTEHGGVGVRVLVDRSPESEPVLKVIVEDTGPGISAEDQAKLFRHFEQTKTGQDAGTGTGLGLAISREFVRLMGGTIAVESRVGKGSTFVIQLPLKAGEAQGVPAKDAPRRVLRLQPSQTPLRVLIADDVADNRELLAQLLTPVGFETRSAHNGAEAVQECETWMPHLILMDYRMPVMDGHEAIRRIRATPQEKTIKIIAVTASALDENRQELLEIGADDFISKPFREIDPFQKIHVHTGVAYVYADEAPTAGEAAVQLSPLSFVDWRPRLIQSMHDAAAAADLDQLMTTIDEAESIQPRVAQALRRLAEEFDYERLVGLFSGGGPNGSGKV